VYINVIHFCHQNGSWLIDVDWVNKIHRRSRDQRKQVKGQTQKEREEKKIEIERENQNKRSGRKK
jgi:hypothetical protein